MIERGRHMNLEIKDRTCKNCSGREVEDEFHAVMTCPKYQAQRSLLFSQLANTLVNWQNLSNQDRFIIIMKAQHIPVQIGQFLSTIVQESHQQQQK